MAAKRWPYAELRHTMRAQGITSTDLAHELLLGSAAISERLNAKRQWSLSEMYAVMRLLHMPHEYLHIIFPADAYSKKRLPESA